MARSSPRSEPTVLYAKLDRASFFDLFSQIIGQLPQAQLQRLIAEAMQHIAVGDVRKARSSDLVSRLKSPEEVAELAQEVNLDRDEVSRTLVKGLDGLLEKSQVPDEIPLGLLKVDSPTLGERTCQWPQGKRVTGLEELGLAHYLGELAQDEKGSSVPDLAAIQALETIAALHRLAGRPLVILIDQLEVFARGVDQERQQVLASLIKKLMEQLGRQNALTFIAGAEGCLGGVSARRDHAAAREGASPGRKSGSGGDADLPRGVRGEYPVILFGIGRGDSPAFRRQAKRSDVELAASFRLNPGSIVAIDRGYIDYALFARWSMAGVFFVTRLKDNAAFEVVEECQLPANGNIRADQLIRLTGTRAQTDYPELLRRIVVWDAWSGTPKTNGRSSSLPTSSRMKVPSTVPIASAWT